MMNSERPLDYFKSLAALTSDLTEELRTTQQTTNTHEVFYHSTYCHRLVNLLSQDSEEKDLSARGRRNNETDIISVLHVTRHCYRSGSRCVPTKTNITVTPLRNKPSHHLLCLFCK